MLIGDYIGDYWTLEELARIRCLRGTGWPCCASGNLFGKKYACERTADHEGVHMAKLGYRLEEVQWP